MTTDFGIFMLMQQRSYSRRSFDILHQAVEQTRVADEAGFGCAWYAEHHFNNYGLCASPLTMVAHCAAVTRRIRLGSGVVIAPLYTPSRLIAETAMVDQLSNGRLNLGIGAGYQQFEFERFGVSLEEAKDRTLEMLDMLELGLQKPIFDYQGHYYQQPPSAISQRAVQNPMPPIWVTSMDPALMRRAIRGGHHLFISGSEVGHDKLKSARRIVDQLTLEEKRNPTEVPLGMLHFAFASDKPAEVDHYLDCARYQRRVALSLKQRRAAVRDDYMVDETPFEGEPTIDDMRARLPVGPVEVVIERMVRDIRVTGAKHVAIQTQVGDLDHATMLRQLELWGEVIIPAVQKEIANDPPYVSPLVSSDALQAVTA
jgi:alkanesulfonate monooxygenase SsuD/methylene tetrahydromethanopterin reductase-like flavin-dependent oxidoreductase (luciferase family)